MIDRDDEASRAIAEFEAILLSKVPAQDVSSGCRCVARITEGRRPTEDYHVDRVAVFGMDNHDKGDIFVVIGEYTLSDVAPISAHDVYVRLGDGFQCLAEKCVVSMQEDDATPTQEWRSWVGVAV